MTADAYKPLLADLQAKIAAFNTERAVDPKGTAEKLAAAHHALAVALEKNKGQSGAVLTSTISFANAASAFQAAVTSAKAPTPAAKKGS